MVRIVVPFAFFVHPTLGFAEPPRVDFAHDVVPILRAKCGECHTGTARKGDLSLNTRESLMASKGVVVSGKSRDSELVKRITAADKDVRMPSKGPALSEKEIATLTAWVDGGASWEPGFSFARRAYVAPLAPRTPTLPAASAPDRTNSIDRILDTYLAKQKQPIPPPADEMTLVRRLFLDLTGLLPTPEQVDAYLADKSPEKYETLVRTLLTDDRRYTEHWLTFWNDLLRNDYSGTGYIDGGRKPITAWLYKALKENKPYDRFVRELIVPTLETEGFTKGIKWRGVVNASQVTELQFAQTVGQVFLGVNLKCASCHDSFIDDWKLTDAYGLAAVVADQPLQLHRCDKPLGQTATAKFLFPELGPLDPAAPRPERLKRVADLLTSPQDGRFARTIANRYWHRFMGRGIVEPVDVMANEPWDADLLDWLASDFVEHKYDLKKLIERIVTSRAYRSASVPPTSEGEPYVYRGPVRKRLTAEEFVDAVWRLTGTAPKQPHAQFKGIDRGREPVRASLVDADLLQRSLGRPNREQVVTTRPEDLSTLQALDLTNGAILAGQLEAGAKAIRAQFPDRDAAAMATWLYRMLLSRSPTEKELAAAVALAGNPLTDSGLADLMWAVLMLPEFQVVR
jgi:hypothetical protein